MRTHFVVVTAPGFDDDLGLGARTELFDAQAFVTELAVEAFGNAILPRLTGIDQCCLDDAARADPTIDLDLQPLPGPFVGDGQALELLAVGAPTKS